MHERPPARVRPPATSPGSAALAPSRSLPPSLAPIGDDNGRRKVKKRQKKKYARLKKLCRKHRLDVTYEKIAAARWLTLVPI